MRRRLTLTVLAAIFMAIPAAAQAPCPGLRDTLTTKDLLGVVLGARARVAETVSVTEFLVSSTRGEVPPSIGAYVDFPTDGKLIVKGNTVYFVTTARSFTIKFVAVTSRADTTAPTFSFTWP